MDREPDEMEPIMSPREIRCLGCSRVLLALQRPRCNWCGMPVPQDDFQEIQARSRHLLDLPDPAPLPPVYSSAQQIGYGGNVWNRQRLGNELLPSPVRDFRPMTPGQARLRLVVILLFGLLAAARLGFLLYQWWGLHRMLQTLPH